MTVSCSVAGTDQCSEWTISLRIDFLRSIHKGAKFVSGTLVFDLSVLEHRILVAAPKWATKAAPMGGLTVLEMQTSHT
jgi:hypothetical protein